MIVVGGGGVVMTIHIIKLGEEMRWWWLKIINTLLEIKQKTRTTTREVSGEERVGNIYLIITELQITLNKVDKYISVEQYDEIKCVLIELSFSNGFYYHLSRAF